MKRAGVDSMHVVSGPGPFSCLMGAEVALVSLSKRIEFAAAHRYVRDEWSEEKNRAVFGACFNEPGHGHNYFLEVTVLGDVDHHTGMVVNLYDLKVVLKQVLEEFDHKHLNLDTPYFKDQVPTTENIARVLWGMLERYRNIGKLETLSLVEDEDLWATLQASRGLEYASVTRRYSVLLASTGLQSRDAGAYDCDVLVTVGGPIDRTTGMAVDLKRMDRIVSEHVLPELPRACRASVGSARVLTGEELAKTAWELMASHVPHGSLERVRLIHSRDLTYEYAG